MAAILQLNHKIASLGDVELSPAGAYQTLVRAFGPAESGEEGFAWLGGAIRLFAEPDGSQASSLEAYPSIPSSSHTNETYSLSVLGTPIFQGTSASDCLSQVADAPGDAIKVFLDTGYFPRTGDGSIYVGARNGYSWHNYVVGRIASHQSRLFGSSSTRWTGVEFLVRMSGSYCFRYDFSAFPANKPGTTSSGQEVLWTARPYGSFFPWDARYTVTRTHVIVTTGWFDTSRTDVPIGDIGPIEVKSRNPVLGTSDLILTVRSSGSATVTLHSITKAEEVRAIIQRAQSTG